MEVERGSRVGKIDGIASAGRKARNFYSSKIESYMYSSLVG